MSTIFLQQILISKLLLAISSGQRNNFNGRFKLKTRNNLPTKIYWENIVNVTLLFI